MILCVTPNPAIDRTLLVNALRVGEVHRAEKSLTAAGGKGLNVARAIHSLGGEPFCMGLIGGHAGNLLAELARREGLPAHWTRMKNETRTCVIVVERGRDATVVNEAGAEVSAEECQAFLNDVWTRAEQAQLVCLSGSLPPGFALDDFARLLRGLVARGKSVWVDTSGSALKSALDVRGVNIKVNAAELGDALGLKISDAEQAVAAGRQLLARGVSSAAATLGKDGAVLVAASGAWIAHSPKVEAVSSVGSGDAFLGGLTFAFDAGKPPDVALRYGVAAGAANALQFGGGAFTAADLENAFAKTFAFERPFENR
ncbi:MAG: 1-phosphofructokinase family hexose kinase [Chloroflexi bacterium]|nr:1-phosphofructokinase family hexose kinase [Chloroflexota bacterium]